MNKVCKNPSCRLLFDGKGDFHSEECKQAMESSLPDWKKAKKQRRSTTISRKMKSHYQTVRGQANLRKLSRKMSENNPMSNDKVIEKMKSTKEKRGTLHTWSGTFGGNKYGATPQQKTLFEALGGKEAGWELEIAIPTKRKSPYPTNYKVDIGRWDLKIGVECDGRSHYTNRKKKAEDIKKTEFLKGLGWTIIRFENHEIEDDVQSCVDETEDLVSSIRVSLLKKRKKNEANNKSTG